MAAKNPPITKAFMIDPAANAATAAIKKKATGPISSRACRPLCSASSKPSFEDKLEATCVTKEPLQLKMKIATKMAVRPKANFAQMTCRG